MPAMREWLTRLHDWMRRDELDAELSEELRFHQARLERDAAADGTLPSDAAGAAKRRMGNLTRVREDARGLWAIPVLDNLHQDLRIAIRGLTQARGFTITVILTLGLGIGANAAMFGVLDRVMFRPFPMLRDPGTVHRVYLQTTAGTKVTTVTEGPYTRYLDFQRFTTSFSNSAGVAEWTLALGSGAASREYRVAGVSASFFDFFDAKPAQGRFFGPSEDAVPRGADVAVLSYAYWQSEFGGRDVVGTSLRVGPLLTTIIGVAPEGFVGVSVAETPAVFLPITTVAYGLNQGTADTFATTYGWTWVSTIVRRKPGVSNEAATADLTRAFSLSRNAQRLLNPRTLPDSIAHPRAIAGALKIEGGPSASLEAKTLLWVSGVALIVLLIACANVANLLFSRMLKRKREIAMRLALGASRPRLVLQFLTESLLLSGLGCAAGVLMAQWVSVALDRTIVRSGASSVTTIDWRTLGVASACAVAAGVITGVGPALLALRGDLTSILRADGRAGTYQRSRLRSTLLVLQGALSVVLLVGAGLFVRSLGNSRDVDLGWKPESVLIVTPNYRGVTFDSLARDAFRRRLLAAAQEIPGVTAAARINSLPFGTNTLSMRVPGVDSVERFGRFNYQATSPGYFATLGTRVLRGRPLTDQDRPDSPPVMVVSEAMARVLWPGQEALGKCIRLGSDTAPCREVVGIAEDVAQQSITDTERFMYYISDEQLPNHPANRIFVRLAGSNPASHAKRVRLALQRLMPGEAYVTVGPLEDLVDSKRQSWKVGATLFVSFGMLALIVAGVGLYSVIGYTVAQRMHELGVRIALGAQSRDIVTLVVAHGMSFAVVGVAVGLVLALFAAPWVEPLLFKQSPRDPVVFAGVALVMSLVALVASAMPALRAIRADPNTALRAD